MEDKNEQVYYDGQQPQDAPQYPSEQYGQPAYPPQEYGQAYPPQPDYGQQYPPGAYPTVVPVVPVVIGAYATPTGVSTPESRQAATQEADKLEADITTRFYPRMRLIRYVQIVVAIIGGIMSQIPTSIESGGVSVKVHATAWIIIACIFAVIAATISLVTMQRAINTGLGRYPVAPLGEFFTLICVFSAAIQMAQACSAVASVFGAASVNGYAVWVIAAILLWVLVVSFVGTVVLRYQIWNIQNQVNAARYQAAPIITPVTIVAA